MLPADAGGSSSRRRPTNGRRHLSRCGEQSFVESRAAHNHRPCVRRGEVRCRKANHAAPRQPWTARQVLHVAGHVGGLASLLVLFLVGLVELVDAIAAGRLHPVIGVAIVGACCYLLQAARGA